MLTITDVHVCCRFDVSEFKPEEVNVKVQNNKLIVNAKHEEKTAQTSVSREYSRQVSQSVRQPVSQSDSQAVRQAISQYESVSQ